ncbi:uncharacterized protein DUF3108 [Paucimonas lemoignei]|uniref:Uncharacterized protein DUF3108 n=1 Tax=Paucimonas lemoignei TaxID=29443 RepID=A0A4R3HX59_PAULE|nr:DUF3108 domain-containing protein [Paucimonas lemoignei]TCS37752.1 uncharacterized protein DUF3108 [Paucimonas lemoignei]
MNSAAIADKTRASSALPWRRWLVVFFLSVALHLLTLNWATGNLRLPGGKTDEAPVVIQTSLVTVPPAPAPRPMPIPVSPQAAKPRPKPARPRATAVPKPAAASPATATPPVLAMTASDSATAMVSQPAMPVTSPSNDADLVIPDLAALGTVDPTPSSPVAKDNSYKFDPPPSATLEYAVQALREGQMVHGHGKIAWQVNGNQYTINGEAGILFFSLLDFGSQGQIDQYGVAPLRYTEKRFRRAQTETWFNRDSKLISFSTSPKSFPLQGGEQDRASIIWQLASIGRGDAARFIPGAQIPLFIAGVRDGSTWNIQVIGEEDTKVGLGELRAWHMRRAPRSGDKDQTLDIWLAPSHHWYPVKLRYTESNGEYLELLLSGIDAPAS